MVDIMTFSLVQPWIFTIVFGVLGFLIIASNYWYLLAAWIKNGTTSLTLFIGAFFGALALLVAPIAEMRWLALIPVMLDPGTNFIIFRFIHKLRKKDVGESDEDSEAS